MPKGGGRTKPREVVFDDGVAYRLGWEPLYQFTLEAGAPAASAARLVTTAASEVVWLQARAFCFLRAGFTKLSTQLILAQVRAPCLYCSMADGAAGALTTQLNYPIPAGYFREYYSRTRRVGDLEPCWREIVRRSTRVSPVTAVFRSRWAKMERS